MTLGDDSDMTVYAYDSSTISARSGRVLATNGSVVSVAGDVYVHASGCSTVVADADKADVAVAGRAVVVPRLWDKSDLDKWVAFTGARDDGDSLVLYTWLSESESDGCGTVHPFYKAHRASVEDAAVFLVNETDKLFEVRVSKNDVTDMWFDRLYATEFTPIREINLYNPLEGNK